MNTSSKILHWAPRTLAIFAILFISVFALDSFNAELTVWQQISAFLIHLIPSFVLLAVLIVAWKWELVGGVVFVLLGLGFTPFIYQHNYSMNHSFWMSLGIVMLITMPFVLVGVLFIISNFKKRNQSELSA